MSIPNYESYYYDDWFGEFHSKIQYAGNDNVYQFSIGFEDPKSGSLQGFKLSETEFPTFPSFIQMEIGDAILKIDELTPDLVSKNSFSGPHKTGFFNYGDSVIYMNHSVTIHFHDGKPVYLYCNGTNVVFRNIKTGNSGRLPMSVRKMKSIFGKPTRTNKDIVL